MEEYVSVLLPVFNGHKYLKDFLESVSNQTYQQIELIIADDHSTDYSFEICEKWCGKNRNRFVDCKLYRNDVNLGLAENTNRLMECATGKYLFLADQDDVWLPQKVERQTAYMNEHSQCIISLSDRSVTDERLNVRIQSEFSNMHYSIESMDFDEYIKYRNHDTAANIMCIREDKKDLLMIPSGIIEHDNFIAVMAVCLGTIDYIYTPLLLYRIHRNNLSGNYCVQNATGLVDCFFCQYRTAKRNNRVIDDNAIIKRELKRRMNIDLDDYSHRLFTGSTQKKVAIAEAVKKTIRAYKNGQIGIWKEK